MRVNVELTTQLGHRDGLTDHPLAIRVVGQQHGFYGKTWFAALDVKNVDATKCLGLTWFKATISKKRSNVTNP